MNSGNISAVILAGGQSRRMDGKNKGLITFCGKPLIVHAIENLKSQNMSIVISANAELDKYRQFGYPVVTDKLPGFGGPLVGIYSAMAAINTDWLLTMPCDTPLLPVDYATRMSAAISHEKAYVAHDGQRQQSGCCLLHKSLQGEILNTLNEGHFAVYKFLNKQAAVAVDFSNNSDKFANINTPEQLTEQENK